MSTLIVIIIGILAAVYVLHRLGILWPVFLMILLFCGWLNFYG